MPSANVKMHNGTPTLFLDGVPTFASIFYQRVQSALRYNARRSNPGVSDGE